IVPRSSRLPALPLFCLMIRPPTRSALFPYTTLFRSIREHLEETKANTEQADHLLKNRLPDEIESLTAWVIPQSRYPQRDWLTTKEAADEAGLPKSTVQTWIDRGKLFEAQIRGLIQKTSSITLIHQS